VICFDQCQAASSETREQDSIVKIPKALCRAALWTSAIAVICSLCLPQLAWMASYVIHGGSVAYKQFDLPIPPGWVVHPSDDSLLFMRMPRFTYERWPEDYIFVSEFIFPKDRTFERWEKAFIQVHTERGYTLQQQVPSHLLSEQRECLVFVVPNNSNNLSIECPFPNSQLSIGFQGEGERSGALYPMIAGVVARN
jgi:hypothetical protein